MPHPQRPADAWRRHVEREQLVSAMNATKWRETTDAMRFLPGGPPGFRIKEIWSDRWWPESYWDHEWFYHLRPWEEIEWLEIQADSRQHEIETVLRAIGAPFSLEAGHLRIWGWLRPGASPRFVCPRAAADPARHGASGESNSCLGGPVR